MQLCDVTVRLGGDVRFCVPRTDVTPAEIMALRHVQGAEDAVTDIVLKGDVDRNMHDEIERLRQIYGAKRVLEVFPGNYPRLPLTLDEIGATPAKVAAPPKAEEKKRRGRPPAVTVETAEKHDEVDRSEASDPPDPADA